MNDPGFRCSVSLNNLLSCLIQFLAITLLKALRKLKTPNSAGLFAQLLLLTLLFYPQIFLASEKTPPAFNWELVQFPKIGKSFSGLFKDDSTGYILVEKKYILSLDNNHWTQMGYIPFYEPNKLFFADLLYVIALNIQTGRYEFTRFENGQWKKITTPNTNLVRDVHVSDDNQIWAACEWGELLHFNGVEWKLITSPSFAHNNRIFVQNDSSIWLAGEYQNKILIGHWNGRLWKRFYLLRNELYQEIGWIGNLDANRVIGLMYHIPDLSYIISPDTVEMKYLADLVCDTLAIAISMFSDSSFILRKSNDKSDFKFYANYRRFTSSSEFLLVYDVDQNYEGYWKAQDNNIYYVRFIPQIMEHDRHTLFRKHYITDFVSYCFGIAFVDVDKNGLEEIYIVDTEKHNLLLSPKKVGAATSAAEDLFIDRAEQFNIQAPVMTRDQKMIYDHGISFADVDNDGDEDGYLTSLYHSNLYFENISGKIFHEKSKQAGISGGEYRSIVGVWADVNNDGLVDLFVTNEDSTNMLFLNKGGNNFVDVTAECGLLSDERGNGAYFGDLDLDGDLDLVVTFHNNQPRIYRNDTDPAFPWQVRVSDVTDDWLNCDVDSNAKNSGCFLADYDNDGDLDLFICYQIFSNRLFQNDGSGRFHDVTKQAGLIDSNLTCAAVFF
ncbi:MAG: VCBS repeat-containing protein, partial [bacterium]|nr:VCBS repeat-containing protein [bacterium]